LLWAMSGKRVVMKKNFLGVVSSVAVLSAFLGNVHAVSVSNVGWNLTDLVKPVSTSTTSYSRTTKQPAELLSGFSASPSSSTSYQADYDRLWNYYNSDNFVESYQEAYRKALIERGFDSSYADRMTASEIKANAVAAFTSPERSAASDRQVSAFSGSAVPLTSTEIQQYAPGAYPGIGTVAGLQPVGYYVGQTQGSITAGICPNTTNSAAGICPTTTTNNSSAAIHSTRLCASKCVIRTISRSGPSANASAICQWRGSLRSATCQSIFTDTNCR